MTRHWKNKVAQAVAGAVSRIMRPLVRIMLQRSVPYRACAEMLRWVYADVAMREFGIEGRRPNQVPGCCHYRPEPQGGGPAPQTATSRGAAV